MKFTALFVGLAAAASGANAIELTQDNFDAETAGKTVFIKFLAPWWGHCKKMKPDWDKLMEGAFYLLLISFIVSWNIIAVSPGASANNYH